LSSMWLFARSDTDLLYTELSAVGEFLAF
jgi:hypothetical protein